MVTNRVWRVCCVCSAALLTISTIVLLFISLFAGRRCPGGAFQRAAVSADSLLCSQIGSKMLQQGGSAVDGAIAALLCTSVVNPHSMGLGGGSVITVKDKTGKVKVFNSRETVPQYVQTDLLKSCPTKFPFALGSKWIGVPGELRGYEAIHKQYGRLPWSKLFEPTITLAREGFPMPDFLGHLLSEPLLQHLVRSTSICEVLCHKNKTVLSKGEMLKFPKLAETMETIAKEGADAFYNGKIGLDLIQDIEAAGGTLNMEDLRSYKVRVDDAWAVPLGDAVMHVPPPPFGGALLAFILKLMEGFHLTPQSMDAEQKIKMYHRYIEAAKFANGQRRSVHDPAFSDEKSANHLIDPQFIDRIRGMISADGTHSSSYYNVTPSSDTVGTTHLSVLDQDGLVVSATSTINQIFGGGVYSPKTGVILNNELSDFCGRADTVRSGERPPSSMSPVILESKSGGILAIGGSGGSMITTAVALSIINHLWLGMNLRDAIEAPIVFVDAKNNVTFEREFDKSVIDGLSALGHNVVPRKYFFNVVNALEKENGCIVAVTDRRKMGESAGY
ncbi:glutathione hydrolase 5 proenzyme [Genypterus blacodes]|uniref:glutathione hydrolase 5 proenzyme n=1 Tax=Genypterus blacodes TaxID=154954 RepID=UPI003F7680E3